MQVSLLGTIGAPQKMKCGGWTGCDNLHDTYDPTSVVLLQDAIKLDEFRACEEWTQAREDKTLDQGLLLIKAEYIIPTLLGHWLDEVSSN